MADDGVITQGRGVTPGKPWLDLQVPDIQIAEITAALDGFSGKAEQAVTTAINATLTAAKNRALAILSSKLAANSDSLARRVFVLRMRKGYSYGQLRIYGKPISLASFPRMQAGDGVDVQIMRGGRYLHLAKAFLNHARVADIMLVYRRMGKKRYPITTVTGPAIEPMLREAGVTAEMNGFIRSRIQEELNRSLDRVLTRVMSKAA